MKDLMMWKQLNTFQWNKYCQFKKKTETERYLISPPYKYSILSFHSFSLENF